MAKYQVLAPVEHDHTLYVPKGTSLAAHWSAILDAEGKPTGYTAPSGGNGRPIAVDASGFIELTALQAGPLRAVGAIGDALPEEGAKSKKKS